MAVMTAKAKSDMCEHSGRERVGEVFEYRMFGIKLQKVAKLEQQDISFHFEGKINISSSGFGSVLSRHQELKQAMDCCGHPFLIPYGHLCCIVNMAYDTRSGDWARLWRLTRFDKVCTSWE